MNILILFRSEESKLKLRRSSLYIYLYNIRIIYVYIYFFRGGGKSSFFACLPSRIKHMENLVRFYHEIIRYPFGTILCQFKYLWDIQYLYPQDHYIRRQGRIQKSVWGEGANLILIAKKSSPLPRFFWITPE